MSILIIIFKHNIDVLLYQLIILQQESNNYKNWNSPPQTHLRSIPFAISFVFIWSPPLHRRPLQGPFSSHLITPTVHLNLLISTSSHLSSSSDCISQNHKEVKSSLAPHHKLNALTNHTKVLTISTFLCRQHACRNPISVILILHFISSAVPFSRTSFHPLGYLCLFRGNTDNICYIRYTSG